MIYTLYKTKPDVNGNSRKIALLSEIMPGWSCAYSQVFAYGAEGWTPPPGAVPAIVPDGTELEITPRQYQELKKRAR